MSRDIALKGGPELLAFLDQLPVKLEKNVIRGALRAGANVVRDQARLNVPAKSGKLRRAIKTDTVTDGATIKARVKLRGNHSFLGWFIEYGAAAHFIRAGSSELSARKLTQKLNREGLSNEPGGVLKIGGSFVSGAVLHPGFAPRPFLRTALDTKANEAVDAVGKYIADRLQFGNLNAPLLEVDE